MDKMRLVELHLDRRSELVRGAAFMGTLLVAEALLLGILVWGWSLWWAMPLILVLAHVVHACLIAFHEASHGNLRPGRWLNDLNGHLLGLFGLLSLSLYRAAHYTHHVYLGTERDEEL